MKTTPARGEPALHVAHRRLGLVYEKQGGLDLARKEYEAALKGRSDSDYCEALKRVR